MSENKKFCADCIYASRNTQIVECQRFPILHRVSKTVLGYPPAEMVILEGFQDNPPCGAGRYFEPIQQEQTYQNVDELGDLPQVLRRRA